MEIQNPTQNNVSNTPKKVTLDSNQKRSPILVIVIVVLLSLSLVVNAYLIYTTLNSIDPVSFALNGFVMNENTENANSQESQNTGEEATKLMTASSTRIKDFQIEYDSNLLAYSKFEIDSDFDPNESTTFPETHIFTDEYGNRLVFAFTEPFDVRGWGPGPGTPVNDELEITTLSDKVSRYLYQTSTDTKALSSNFPDLGDIYRYSTGVSERDPNTPCSAEWFSEFENDYEDYNENFTKCVDNFYPLSLFKIDVSDIEYFSGAKAEQNTALQQIYVEIIDQSNKDKSFKVFDEITVDFLSTLE